jgi:hypothetical protein
MDYSINEFRNSSYRRPMLEDIPDEAYTRQQKNKPTSKNDLLDKEIFLEDLKQKPKNSIINIGSPNDSFTITKNKISGTIVIPPTKKDGIRDINKEYN